MRVLSNAAIFWVVRVLTLFSSGCLSILTARVLGPAGRGSYALPAIDVSLATTFAAGISAAAAYFLLAKQAGSSFLRAVSIAVLSSVIIGVCLTCATAAISHSLWAAIPAVCFMIGYFAYQLAYGLFLGMNRARSAALVSASGYLLTLLFVSAGLFIDRSSPSFAIAGWVAGMAIAGLLSATFAIKDCARLVGDVIGYRKVVQFALRAGLVNMVNLLNYRVDIFIVAISCPISVVGLYTLAVTGAESVLSMTQALSAAALPRVGSLEATEAGLFTARCLRNGVLVALVLALFAFACAPLAIKIILGPAYVPMVLPLRVLLVGLVAASTSAVIGNYFMINKGRTRVPLLTSSLSAAICAAISLPLVPRLGMLGAAIGSTIAYVISQSLAIYLFCRESGLSWQTTLFIDRADLAFYGRLMRRLTARTTG